MPLADSPVRRAVNSSGIDKSKRRKPSMVYPLAGRSEKLEEQRMDARARIKKLGVNLLKQALENRTMDDLWAAFDNMAGLDAQ